MRYFIYLATGALILMLGACSSGPKIIANNDPDADFTAYRTYSFVDPLSTDSAGVRDIVSGFLIRSTSAELEARGLTRSADPDLLVDFFVTTREKIQARNSPSGSISMNRGYGRYGTWNGYSMSMSTSTVTSTIEGTVAIDIIDRKLGQKVWEAAAIGRVTEKTRDNLDTVVPAVVAELFQRYPVPLPQASNK